jgi:hypothetical protein
MVLPGVAKEWAHRNGGIIPLGLGSGIDSARRFLNGKKHNDKWMTFLDGNK